jgi:hypothetical protein
MEFLNDIEKSAFRAASDSAAKWFPTIARICAQYPDAPSAGLHAASERLENLRREVVTHGPVLRMHEEAIIQAAVSSGTPHFQFGGYGSTIWTSAHFASLGVAEGLLRDICYLFQPLAEDRSEVNLFISIEPERLLPNYQCLLNTLNHWASWHEPEANSKVLEDYIRIESAAVLPKSSEKRGTTVGDIMMAQLLKMRASGQLEDAKRKTIKDWQDFIAPLRNGRRPSPATIHATEAWETILKLKEDEKAERIEAQSFRDNRGRRRSTAAPPSKKKPTYDE